MCPKQSYNIRTNNNAVNTPVKIIKQHRILLALTLPELIEVQPAVIGIFTVLKRLAESLSKEGS